MAPVFNYSLKKWPLPGLPGLENGRDHASFTHMAKPEQCAHCGKPATIHLTQIINNKIHKVDLCEECPHKQGVTDPEGFSLADFLLKPAAMAAATENLRCEHCGFTPSDFKKTGRFGCPHCYESFKGMLKPMLVNMHRDTHHRGKVPEKAVARIEHQAKLGSLRRELEEAIGQEQYEQAARLRDAIRELENIPAMGGREESS